MGQTMAGSKILHKSKGKTGPKAKRPLALEREQRLETQEQRINRKLDELGPHVRPTWDDHPGRPKGKVNNISRLTREAIFEGLSRCGGREGMVGFVIRATEDNIKNGVAMLNMITPRIVDALVTHNDMIFQSLAEVDTALAARGLPTSQEIFKLDYRGDPDDDSVVIENEKDNVSS
jgi:hypothetical protein